MPVTASQMAQRIARFRELKADPDAFPDLKDPARQRAIYYVISPNETAGPAAISAPHNFHIAIITAGRGSHFDPDIVDAFLAREEQFRAIVRRYRDEVAPTPPLGG